MANNNYFNKYNYSVASHLKKNTALLIWVAIFCLIGIVIGIVLLFGEKSYLNLLTTKNQNLLGYISGSAKIFSIFWNRLFSGLFAVIILFLFSLNYYTSFLCFLYFAYQSAICTIAIGTLIGYHGFSAVINTVFLIAPANLLLLTILALFFSIFFTRAKSQNKYKINFAQSFSHNNFWELCCIVLILLISLYIIVNLIIPLIIKGIYIINY